MKRPLRYISTDTVDMFGTHARLEARLREVPSPLAGAGGDSASGRVADLMGPPKSPEELVHMIRDTGRHIEATKKLPEAKLSPFHTMDADGNVILKPRPEPPRLQTGDMTPEGHQRAREEYEKAKLKYKKDFEKFKESVALARRKRKEPNRLKMQIANQAIQEREHSRRLRLGIKPE